MRRLAPRGIATKNENRKAKISNSQKIEKFEIEKLRISPKENGD
jgi:hypothetical protein